MRFPDRGNPLLVIEPRQAEALGLRLHKDERGRPWSWSTVADLMRISAPSAFTLAVRGWEGLRRAGYTSDALRAQIFPRRPERPCEATAAA